MRTPRQITIVSAKGVVIALPGFAIARDTSNSTAITTDLNAYVVNRNLPFHQRKVPMSLFILMAKVSVVSFARKGPMSGRTWGSMKIAKLVVQITNASSVLKPLLQKVPIVDTKGYTLVTECTNVLSVAKPSRGNIV